MDTNDSEINEQVFYMYLTDDKEESEEPGDDEQIFYIYISSDEEEDTEMTDEEEPNISDKNP